jgi:opacity protein-like surface antigen
MKFSRLLSVLFAVAVLAGAGKAFCQTMPAAYEGNMPFTLGVGVSNFNVDWDNQRMYAIGVNGVWRPAFFPSRLYGLGIEVEGRDLNYDHPAPALLPSNFREDTLSGGAVYNWHHYRRFEPYVMYLVGIGSIDFHAGNPYYNHDTRTVYTPGGGVQYRVANHVWLRGDYEYEFWNGLFGKTADPNGYTAGVAYNFRSFLHFTRD